MGREALWLVSVSHWFANQVALNTIIGKKLWTLLLVVRALRNERSQEKLEAAAKKVSSDISYHAFVVLHLTRTVLERKYCPGGAC